jgi:hypothetical protein
MAECGPKYMKEANMQIIGLCRFSYPCLGGFQTGHDTLQDRIDYLFGDTRLEERFRTFEHITMPGIRNQTDQDFTFLVVTGTDLPAKHLKRLHAIIAGMPNVQLLQVRPMKHRPAMRQVLKQFRDPKQGPSVEFRLDDDDAVAIDFVEKLRETAQKSMPLFQIEKRVAIDFNHGLVLQIGQQIKAGHVVKSCWTPALGVMLGALSERCAIDFGHHKLLRTMTTITRPLEDMYVRGLSDFNDSTFDRQEGRLAPMTDEIRQLLKARFYIDVDAIPLDR